MRTCKCLEKFSMKDKFRVRAYSESDVQGSFVQDSEQMSCFGCFLHFTYEYIHSTFVTPHPHRSPSTCAPAPVLGCPVNSSQSSLNLHPILIVNAQSTDNFFKEFSRCCSPRRPTLRGWEEPPP